MSEEPEPSLRLDRIETRWSLIQRAHGSSVQSAEEARRALVIRYSSAIRRYIGAMTRNSEETDEIAQDVVVRLLRGDFSGADVARGRFRDLLKTAVRNMVRKHWNRENRRRGVEYDLELMSDERAADENDPWLDNWRKNVLDLAWLALEQYEAEHEGRIPHTLLRLRSRHPDENSEQLAVRLSGLLGHEINASAVRQQLRRARLRFAQFLVDEIADGLVDASGERVEEELINLGLYEYVKDVLPKS